MRGTRLLAAMAAALPLFYFSPWVELTAVDQPSHVQPGTSFSATVEGIAHLSDGLWPPDIPLPAFDTGPTLPIEPPADVLPGTTGSITPRLGALVPTGWKVTAVDYTVTGFFPMLPAPQRQGTLAPQPDEAWVYEAYRPAPPGFEWQAFAGPAVDVTWEAQVRFVARAKAGTREGRYRLTYGTWSHPPYWYLDGGGTPPPADSLVPVPPPTFVEADIIVGDVGPAPTVVSFDPPDGAGDVAVDSDIRVAFDRDMDLSSLRDGGIQVYAGPVFYATDGDPATKEGPAWSPDTPLDPLFRIPPWEPWPLPVQIFWNAATKTAVVDPDADLADHTVHTIVVTYQARAADGVPVDTIRTATFLTERLPAPPFFSDVPAGHRFRRAIETLFDAGIVTGFPDGTFKPDAPVTRGQVATMLVRVLGLHTPQPDDPPPFRDLPAPADDVGADYIAEAARAGIAAGFDDGTFRPHEPVTRIQMTRMIVRAAQPYMAAPPPDYSAGFGDVDQVDQGYVNWATYNDLADGKAPGRFDPWSTATRGHAARLLYGVWNVAPRSYPTPEPGPTGSGIDGFVTLGPLNPVEQPGEANERPYRATIVIRALEPGGPPEGREVRRVESGPDGRFHLDLPPGTYLLDPLPGGAPWPSAQPTTVTVETGAYTEVHIPYDTGIR